MRQVINSDKCFVTGGAGFIGSHLVDRLMIEGNEVTVYDNFTSGKKIFVEHHLGKHGFKLINADLLDVEMLINEMRNHNIVFHMAANPEARAGIEDTDRDLQQGTIATYNVLEAMRLNGINRVIFSSSGTVYGETPAIAVAECYGPLLTISLYGASKLACEGLISAYSHIFNIQAWIFRFANVVGNRSTHGVIFDFVAKLKGNPNELEILGDGSQEKPYLYVDDCIDGIIYGIRNSNEKINLFNLGCISTTKVNTIAQIVTEEMCLKNVHFKFTGGKRGWPGDVPVTYFDISKMKNLGWQAHYSSDEAVRTAVKKLLG